ncbi:hypothetical protein [Bartonella ancashensis]|uniref:transglycosylase SLT domain-containing protein n=1 Tax=Bartonella ancashensis TaxID=1318743 RepID=UPI000A88E9AF|nr:hypothetical protein [Bartonella ancashensis]
MWRFLFLGVIPLFLGGCITTAPTHTNNACSVLEQKDGFFENWRKSAKKAEARYGIPMPIILATIRMESNFRHNARPSRKKLLGFIPWKRRSTAYGYSQALDGTWETYVRSTKRSSARRTNFADAADFVAWYHYQSVLRNGVNRNDAHNLYLNYYMGHGAYARNRSAPSAAIANTAQRMERMAILYDQQLRECGKR